MRAKNRGAAGMTYATMVGLVAVIGILAISSVGGSVNLLMTGVSNRMGGVTNGVVTVTPPAPPPPAPTMPHSCAEALASGSTTNGTYTIDLDDSGPANPISVYCDMAAGGWTYAAAGTTFRLDLTSSVQTIVTPARTTEYHFDLYGAQGGLGYGSVHGGLGGQASGNKVFGASTTLYAYVGGQGGIGGAADVDTYGTPVRLGGYNGGGTGTRGGSGGGGATDIRTVGGAWNDSGSLNSRLLVAGGGGGCGSAACVYPGGSGGGLSGGDGGNPTGKHGSGATQTGIVAGSNGAVNAGFGFGGDNTQINDEGGGGGGWYGGTPCGASNCAAGGGSGYVGGMDSNTFMTNGVNSGNGYLTYIFK